MILEHTLFSIAPGSEQDFERAIGQAEPLIAQSPGFVSLRLHRGVEDPSEYLLLAEWETLDDHMVGFRKSERFAAVLDLIRPWFASPPKVSHLEPVFLSH
jgi:heme-degrading monooxygenase HmoA